jgi:serine/threonine protein phosphatase PrpC
MKATTPSSPLRAPVRINVKPEQPQVATIRGRRANQEDRFLILRAGRKRDGVVMEQGWLMAVMDGHGGPEAAQAVETRLPHAFQKAFAEHGGDYRKLLERAVAILNEDPHVKYQLSSGTTLSMAYVADGKPVVHVAHLGDSPVIVFDSAGHILFRTEEHNIITNPKEVDRVRELSKQRHGEDRVKVTEQISSTGRTHPHYLKDRRMDEDFTNFLNETLDLLERVRAEQGEEYSLEAMDRDAKALARIMKGRGVQNIAQLGAFPFDAILIRQPDIEEFHIEPDCLPAYLLLATDGILDLQPGAEVTEVEKQIAHMVAVEHVTPRQLLEKAGGERSHDNTTVLMYKIPSLYRM